MRIFIIGMPGSCRTTIAKILCQNERCRYIDSISWIKSTFRDPKTNEHPEQYHDAYHQWLLNRMKEEPNLGTANIINSIAAYDKDNAEYVYVIDGIASPTDFAKLFNYNKDIVIFLNRIDNDVLHKDYENIGVSVMRDYCFWMSSAELLARDKWLEFNFKLKGAGDYIKEMGSKNTVIIVSDFPKVVQELTSRIFKLI